MEAGVAVHVAVASWVGPLDGVQDFEIGTGALEVKTTIATGGFTARIGSLEQLDDDVRQPLFVVGAKLKQVATGQNLPALVAAIKAAVAEDERPVLDVFERLRDPSIGGARRRGSELREPGFRPRPLQLLLNIGVREELFAGDLASDVLVITIGSGAFRKGAKKCTKQKRLIRLLVFFNGDAHVETWIALTSLYRGEAFAEAARPREKVDDRNRFEPRSQFFSFWTAMPCLLGGRGFLTSKSGYKAEK